MIYRFGDCELDDQRYELRRGGALVHLEPQVFEVLAYLARHRDRVVPKAELLDQIWGSRFVSESALTSRLKAARRAVGDSGREQRVIGTVHGRGYRFLAPVRETGPAPVGAVDTLERAVSGSATLPLRGAERREAGSEAAPVGPGFQAAPEAVGRAGIGARVGLVAGVAVVVSGPWLAPSLLRPGGVPVRPEGVAAFAARAEGPLGTVGSLIGLGGI